ncbi:putative aminotransferase family protein [Xylaria intraflava]|nr:putative aminotransferase family protein [Xylaria intraflava]
MTESTPTSSGPSVPFGRPMRDAHFGFSSSYTPINHGSYGTYPIPVREVRTALQAEAEESPDPFIILDWPARILESRALTANLLHCATEDLVFSPNATTGVETIIKNIRWQPGDVILVHELVYGSVLANLNWVAETADVRVEILPIAFPMSDDDLVETMTGAVRRINASGKERVRLAIIDTIISLPGLRLPFERLVPRLQAEGALVLVDGAHGIGHIDVDLAALNPDFFVSNLHKWLFVPRGAAAVYVARRHQAVIRASVPTSARLRKVDDVTPGAFVSLFDFIATVDNTNLLTVKASLDFRNQVCGGEEAIRKYSHTLAQESGEIAAKILGTEVMDIAGSCLRDCNFSNVRLPLEVAGEGSGPGGIPAADGDRAALWIKATGSREAGCFFQTCFYRGKFWWRLSGMIYLDVEDFRKAAEVVKGICERAARGEYLQS